MRVGAIDAEFAKDGSFENADCCKIVTVANIQTHFIVLARNECSVYEPEITVLARRAGGAQNHKSLLF
jgi:hypothetical protein